MSEASSDYQLFNVHLSDDVLVARLMRSQLMGLEERELLAGDFRRLLEAGPSAVQLDLRLLVSMDGSIPGMLLELARSLRASGGRLSVAVSPPVADVLQVTKLDQLFEVVVAQ